MYETTLDMPRVPGQPPTHHPMQVHIGNQYRVSPDSHLTTLSLCDIYLIISCLFGQQNFSGSHCRSLHPPTFFGLPPVDTLSNKVFRLFTRVGYLSPTCYARHISFSIFSYHCGTQLDFVPFPSPHDSTPNDVSNQYHVHTLM